MLGIDRVGESISARRRHQPPSTSRRSLGRCQVEARDGAGPARRLNGSPDW
jgi:hypothetical protein